MPAGSVSTQARNGSFGQDGTFEERWDMSQTGREEPLYSPRRPASERAQSEPVVWLRR